MTKDEEIISVGESQDDELSRAIVLYIGRGRFSTPRRNPDAVDIEFGSARGEELTAAVEKIVAELDRLDPDWSRHDLSQATDWAEATMAERHPELSAEAAGALAWRFSWVWR